MTIKPGYVFFCKSS